MRWIAYLILGYVALGIQIGFAGFVNVRGAAPNVVLLCAIFIALNAPREPALLGSLLLGILQDLLTQQILGIHAFSYGMVAMFIISTQAIVFREHPMTHLSMTFMGMLIVSMVMLIQGWIWFDAAHRLSVASLIYSTIYTSILAPFVLGALGKVRFVFGFQPLRRARI